MKKQKSVLSITANVLVILAWLFVLALGIISGLKFILGEIVLTSSYDFSQKTIIVFYLFIYAAAIYHPIDILIHMITDLGESIREYKKK